MTHRDVVELAFDRRFDRAAHQRVMLHTPVVFDPSEYELWVPLALGGTVVVAPPGYLDARALGVLIARHGVTATWLTTPLFNLVAAERPEALAGLRLVLTGGEAGSSTAMRRVLAACPGIVVGNGYGPTEATAIATYFFMRGPGEVADEPPIGRLAGQYAGLHPGWRAAAGRAGGGRGAVPCRRGAGAGVPGAGGADR